MLWDRSRSAYVRMCICYSIGQECVRGYVILDVGKFAGRQEGCVNESVVIPFHGHLEIEC